MKKLFKFNKRIFGDCKGISKTKKQNKNKNKRKAVNVTANRVFFYLNCIHNPCQP